MSSLSTHLYRLTFLCLLLLPPVLSGAQETSAKRSLPQLNVDLNALTYPTTPQRTGVQGRVLLAFTITARGRADNIEIVSAEPAEAFDATAIRAVRQVQFTVPRNWKDSGGEAQRFQLSVLFKLSPCVAPACIAPTPHEGADDFVVISAQGR